MLSFAAAPIRARSAASRPSVCTVSANAAASPNGTGVYACQNLVIIKTLPGLAPAVCTAVDGIAPLPGLVGSLSGNDTVFLAMRDNAAAETLAREGRSLFMG